MFFEELEGLLRKKQFEKGDFLFQKLVMLIVFLQFCVLTLVFHELDQFALNLV